MRWSFGIGGRWTPRSARSLSALPVGEYSHHCRITVPPVLTQSWHWPCCTLMFVRRWEVMCYSTKCDCVCVCVIWHTKHAVYVHGMWILMCGIYIYGTMYRVPPQCEASLCLYGWTGMQTSQSSDTVPPHSCHFLGQSHTQRLLSSLSVEERVCACVCSASLCP